MSRKKYKNTILCSSLERKITSEGVRHALEFYSSTVGRRQNVCVWGECVCVFVTKMKILFKNSQETAFLEKWLVQIYQITF